MGMKLDPRDAALYAAVDEVLHYIWDPIGVQDVPQARDEYHSYLPQVFRLLREAQSAESIAGYLGTVRTQTMGLSGNSKHDLSTAVILTDWKDASMRNSPNKRIESAALLARFTKCDALCSRLIRGVRRHRMSASRIGLVPLEPDGERLVSYLERRTPWDS